MILKNKNMNSYCVDNRFAIIKLAKEDLIKSTNIESDKEEMKVIDNILYRCWQMGWLKKYEDIIDKHEANGVNVRINNFNGNMIIK